MSAIFQRRPDGIFILTEDESFYSREDRVLKQDATPYDAGTLVVAEVVSSAVTGKYVRATATTDAEVSGVKEPYALVVAYTDATAADALVAGIVRFARVKSAELEFDSTLNLATVTGLLETQGVIVS